MLSSHSPSCLQLSLHCHDWLFQQPEEPVEALKARPSLQQMCGDEPAQVFSKLGFRVEPKEKRKRKDDTRKKKIFNKRCLRNTSPRKTCSYHATSVGEGTVTAHKDITSNRLPKNFHAKYICDHLLSFLSKTTNKYMNKCRSNLKFTWIQKVYVIF